MKIFRVREIYKMEGWSYIKAKDIKEAEEKFNMLDISNTDFKMDQMIHEDTDWDTLEELDKEWNEICNRKS